MRGVQESNDGAGEGGLAARQPRTSLADVAAQAGAEVAFSALPLVGSALQTAFASAANYVSVRKTEAWLAELAQMVDQLAARQGLRVDEVVADPTFYETLVRATRAAQATGREEKLAALQAIVLNSGSWSPTPDVVQLACLRIVDELQAEHMLLLEALANPDEWLAAHPSAGEGHPATVGDLVSAIFELHDSNAADYLALRFLDELHQRGLISQSVGLAYEIKPLRSIDTAITPLGTAVLQMITKRDLGLIAG